MAPVTPAVIGRDQRECCRLRVKVDVAGIALAVGPIVIRCVVIIAKHPHRERRISRGRSARMSG